MGRFTREELQGALARDAPTAIAAWLEAGGKPAKEIMTHDERAV